MALSILFVAPHLARWESQRAAHQRPRRDFATEIHEPERHDKVLVLAANILAMCAILGAAFSYWLSLGQDFIWSEHETYRSVMAAIFLSAVLFFSVDAARGKRTMLPVGIATAFIVGFL